MNQPLTLALSIVFAPLCAAQTTWYVDVNGTPPGTGTPGDPYTSIQFAIAQTTTVAGDTVLVAPGTYENEAVHFLGKDLRVESQAGAGLTTIVAPPPTAQSTVSTIRFVLGETALAELKGFTITGGSGTQVSTPWGHGAGGGIFCDGASPRITECIITGNTALAGAGVYVRFSSIRMQDCTIRANGSIDATLAGGGLVTYFSSPELVRVVLSDHAVELTGGGAIFFSSPSTLTDCSVLNNTTESLFGGGILILGRTTEITETIVRNNRAGFPGGGIAVRGNALVTVRDCLIELNDALDDAPHNGGGVFIDGSTLVMSGTVLRRNSGQFGAGIHVDGDAAIRGCTFEDNVASGANQYTCAGGGLFVASGVVTVEDSVFTGNIAEDYLLTGTPLSQGGGAVSGSATLTRCTLFANLGVPSGGGALGATLVDCIVRGNTPDQLASAVATYSNIEGEWPGTGNIDAEARFWGEAARDFHLLPGSPCIDAGSPASPLDADMTRADMGAFPFDPTYCGTGCLGPVGASYCTAAANSSGFGASLSALGHGALAGELLLLRVTRLPLARFGYFLMSDGQAFVPMVGGGQGNLCLASPIVRFDTDVLSSGVVGEVNYLVRITDLPQGIQFQVGENWNFQFWFRDSNPQPTSNMSDGVSITWQ